MTSSQRHWRFQERVFQVLGREVQYLNTDVSKTTLAVAFVSIAVYLTCVTVFKMTPVNAIVLILCVSLGIDRLQLHKAFTRADADIRTLVLAGHDLAVLLNSLVPYMADYPALQVREALEAWEDTRDRIVGERYGEQYLDKA